MFSSLCAFFNAFINVFFKIIVRNCLPIENKAPISFANWFSLDYCSHVYAWNTVDVIYRDIDYLYEFRL